MVISNYLGIKQLPTRAQYYIRSFLLFQSFSSFLLLLSNTFFVLYSLDRIGFALTSVTLSFSFFVQLIFDYPSGSLGDWIGQRWVLIIAYVSYGTAFFLTTSAETFSAFMIIAFFNGFGNAQNSGAIATWLDNNYQKVVGDSDPERKIYGFSRARVITTTRVASAFSFMVGGILATLMSRQFVFGLQAVSLIIIIILVYIVVTDEKVDESSENKINMDHSSNNYFKHLAGGVKFLLSSKAAFFFILGSALLFASFAIWGNLILFPIYFGYSGSDGLASTLRTIVFFVGVPISLYTAKLSQRFTTDKVPHVTFLFVLLFYPLFIILTSIMPITNELNLIGCVISLIILNATIPTLFDLGATLRQRVMVDLVPSEHRNAVYSLIPTIISILGIFLLPIAGVLIESYGLPAGITAAFIVGVTSAIMITIGMFFYMNAAKEKLESMGIQVTIPATTGP
ncbi:MAG: MFS transporter [Candidatus Heimdallarchaeota archaeon]|nr:MAG: MFS transporter [Candidatus Heimdallarchaeota archaeon]